MVFERANETGDLGGKFERCPGESCNQFSSRFPKTKGKMKDRLEEACAGCGKCDGNPPKTQRNSKPGDVSELIEEIEELILWENANHHIAWEIYPFEYAILHRLWRTAEGRVKEIREMRMQAFLKGWMSED